MNDDDDKDDSIVATEIEFLFQILLMLHLFLLIPNHFC